MQLAIEIILGKFLNQGYALNQQKFINEELNKIKDQITKYEPLKIAVGTWNLAGVKYYEQIDLKPWILDFPDLLVLGFQDCAQVNVSVMKTSIDGQAPINKFQGDSVIKHLNKVAPELEYQVVGAHTMIGGLHTLLIAKGAIKMRVTDIVTSQVSKGGKIGSCTIRFNYADTSFCFMNCHLEGDHWTAQRRMSTLKECYEESFNQFQERGAAN